MQISVRTGGKHCNLIRSVGSYRVLLEMMVNNIAI